MNMKRFRKSQEGQGFTEYIILVGLIALVVAGSAALYGKTLASGYDKVANEVDGWVDLVPGAPPTSFAATVGATTTNNGISAGNFTGLTVGANGLVNGILSGATNAATGALSGATQAAGSLAGLDVGGVVGSLGNVGSSILGGLSDVGSSILGGLSGIFG